ncbi:papilin-like isoform X2 [Dermacentor silvarum]|uniref:papilin-like isoform X2 n=1 Tax=Dermacentor silvarum TaxID=543639 RepID=UPI00210097C1|nr:papilin-like isoform X2 [Dermacentor silvarum]
MKLLTSLLLFFRLMFAQAVFRKPQVKNATVPLVCHMSPYQGNDCSLPGALWYYDLQIKSCKMLTTGSCGSGRNRFATIGKCQQLCQPPTGRAEHICLEQPAPGMCSHVSHAWYFERSSQKCKKFSYTACSKQHNFFLSEMKCQSVCLRSANHWYFDENKNTCLVFLKNRCGKNSNRFQTFTQCMKRCSYYIS